jgi:hypothetical protein
VAEGRVRGGNGVGRRGQAKPMQSVRLVADRQAGCRRDACTTIRILKAMPLKGHTLIYKAIYKAIRNVPSYAVASAKHIAAFRPVGAVTAL